MRGVLSKTRNVCSGLLLRLGGEGSDLVPGQLHVRGFGKTRANGHAQKVSLLDLRRHHVNLAIGVDSLQQRLIRLVCALETQKVNFVAESKH